MDEYIAALRDRIMQARKNVSKHDSNRRAHPSHREYSEGVADGLQMAYALLTDFLPKPPRDGS